MAFQCSMRGLKAHKVHQRQAVCQSHLPVPGVPLQSVQRFSASQSARTGKCLGQQALLQLHERIPLFSATVFAQQRQPASVHDCWSSRVDCG